MTTETAVKRGSLTELLCASASTMGWTERYRHYLVCELTNPLNRQHAF